MKYALVTGGSRGIGRAVCVKLASMGYNVVINYVSNEAEALKTKEMADCVLMCFVRHALHHRPMCQNHTGKRKLSLFFLCVGTGESGNSAVSVQKKKKSSLPLSRSGGKKGFAQWSSSLPGGVEERAGRGGTCLGCRAPLSCQHRRVARSAR